MKNSFYILLFALALASCSNNEEQENNTNPPKEKYMPVAPAFNADSAYAFTKKQVDFGPRIPDTKPHAGCADWLIAKLRSYTLDVTVQQGKVTAYNQKVMPVKNIIASYRPDLSNRVLLCGHYDTRPFADRDTFDTDKPFDGADDGASDAAVLLEIARQLGASKLNTGVDLIFFDMEDYGTQYCLGSQYWAQHLHKEGYFARYGILLDMVGARNATFPMEGNSRDYASSPLKNVWGKAARLGYSNYFLYLDANPITDDHYYVNTLAHIPCIDIIGMNPVTNDFGPHHHRHSDNMDVIDKSTLKAVGQTVMETIFSEKINY